MARKQKFEGLTPLTTNQDATFIWDGPHPPVLVGDFNEWDGNRGPWFRRAGPGRWSATVSLPADAYIEYALMLNGERQPDPNNPRRLFNGVDDYNHFFYMPAAGPTPLAQRVRGVPHGEVTREEVSSYYLGGAGRPRKGLYQRTVYFYQPPASGPCPLLVVYDGTDYLHRASLANLLDNLIAQKRIQPLAAVLVANGGVTRVLEYSCNDATLGFLTNTLLPLARQRLNILDPLEHPGVYGVLGASMGGLMSIYTALRLPQIFGRALSQSGAFGPELMVSELVRLAQSQEVKIWMDTGRFDFLLEENRQMLALMREYQYSVTYREYSGGHNYTAWRDDVWRGLEILFPLEKAA